ncbi:MAG: hypothetical protein K5923_04170 [Clostridia bacterium]|nr:hypothetical protein [Clostridia bacterium]
MRRIKILIVNIMLIVIFVFVVGCKDNKIISYGFGFESMQEEMADIFIAYSIQTQINLDEEIVIDIYYGHIAVEMPPNIGTQFDLIIYSSKQDSNRIEKEISGFYDNEEYLCSLSRKSKYSKKWEINYSHKEIIALPRDLFREEEDEIVLLLEGISELNDKRSAWISFCYSKSNAGNITIKRGANSNINYTK